MYKSISLAALLLPFFCHGITKEARIKELKEAQHQKSIEIHDLAKRISDADDYIHSCARQYKEFSQRFLHKQSIKGIAEEKATQQLEEEIKAIAAAAETIICTENSMRVDLLRELFDQDDIEAMDSFKSLSFMVIRSATEREILTSFVARYQKLAQELFKIKQELNNL